MRAMLSSNRRIPKMHSCVKLLGHPLSLLLAMCCCFAVSEYTFRVRLHSGRTVRVSVGDDSTFADLHGAIEKGGYFSDGDTDTVQFAAGSDSGHLLRSNYTKLAASLIGSGDVLQLVSMQSTPATPSLRPVRSVAAAIRKNTRLKKVASLDDLKKRRNSLRRIISAAADRNGTEVHIGTDAVSAALTRLPAGVNSSLSGAYGGVALLLGTRRNGSVHVQGVVQVCQPSAHSLAEPTDAASAHSATAAFVTQQALRMARLLGLQVVGCAVGSASWTEARSPALTAAARRSAPAPAPAPAAWSAEHVRAALFLRGQCLLGCGDNCTALVDPFVVLSVKQQGRQVSALGELQLEAYQLSTQALELHKTGVLLTSSAGSNSRVPNNREELRLSAPVLVGGTQEVQALDCLLLAVPLPLVRAAAGGGTAGAVLRHSSFPSLLELQASRDSAQGARAYLQRLLDALVGDSLDEDAPAAARAAGGGARGRPDALRDPQLLLYLALQLGDVAPADRTEGQAEQTEEDSRSPSAVLFRFLGDSADTDPDSSAQPPLPLEVAAVLDAVRRSLR